MGDYFAVLGLQPGASEEAIKSAFRKELLRFHPDQQHEGGYDAAACTRRTAAIIAAYTVLRNPTKRAEYERRGR